METRTVEQVKSWSTRSVAGGYAGLRELSDGEFSGAIRAGGAWLFMLNGRTIGVFEGTLEDFEEADVTAHTAPHPSLPLLFSMQEQGGETQAKYYTNDTPLTEVDSTLTDGKFTGFIELSENVLSGDYYVAYYGGRSMSVAFVGASEQIVTGEEAFERAADEVGIYEVRDVEIEVIDIPEPEGDDPADDSAVETSGSGVADDEATGGSIGGGETSSEPADSETAETGETDDVGVNRDPTTGAATTSNTEATSDERSATSPDTTESSASSASGNSADGQTTPSSSSANTESRTKNAGQAGDAERTTDADGGTTVESPARTESSSSSPEPSLDTPTEQSKSDDATTEAETTATGGTEQESSTGSREAEWRESTTIPSLDPDLSEGPEKTESESQRSETVSESDSRGASASGTRKQSKSTQSSSPTSQSGAQTSNTTGSSARAESSTSGTSASDSESKSSSNAKARIRKLRKQLRQRKQQVDQLKDRLSTLESERNEYKRERDALRQEVERLEAKLETSSSVGASNAGRRLTAAEAFDGTNLFVRYQSKGEATLSEAAKGQADPSDVNANLRLEHHTQFETTDATVDNEPFDAFLTNSFEYEFVSWIIEDLLYEIRDTGHRNDLKDLYEAIPKIDRVDLHGTVSASGDGEESREESFDVIMRDRMGDPLVVADLNGSREPTTGELMGSLVEAASGVSQAHDELAGAFQVTESFFEPEALETAEAATSGGFLSREKRASFVKLSRKRGYHLCLVEARSDDFHLSVPEL